MCVRVLRAEDGPDLIHPPHITRDAHLFSELGTLDASRECLDDGDQERILLERDKRADGNNPL